MSSKEVSIVSLAQLPQYAGQVGQWHYDEWGHLYGADMKPVFFSDMKRCAEAGEQFPQTWLAVVDDKPVGSISILEEDLEDYKHLTPWLMNVLVLPDYRGLGIATKLVNHLKQWAATQGIATLYLYTEDQQNLYTRLGFVAFDESAISDHPITLMRFDLEDHYRSLERMYQAAPLNKKMYHPEVLIKDRWAQIIIELSHDMHHSAHAVHGSVYFKMLDDAAFFAANSIEPNVFVLTASFTTNLLRPVVNGKMRSVGEVVSVEGNKIYAKSVVYDEEGNELGNGEGLFVRSKTPLIDADGYAA